MWELPIKSEINIQISSHAFISCYRVRRAGVGLQKRSSNLDWREGKSGNWSVAFKILKTPRWGGCSGGTKWRGRVWKHQIQFKFTTFIEIFLLESTVSCPEHLLILRQDWFEEHGLYCSFAPWHCSPQAFLQIRMSRSFTSPGQMTHGTFRVLVSSPSTTESTMWHPATTTAELFDLASIYSRENLS